MISTQRATHSRGNAFRILMLSTALSAVPGAALARTEAPSDEIVVTAQKRSERLQDVPVAITAIENAELLRRQITGNQDLARLVPSLVVKPLAPGESQFTIRGINTGYQLAPSVSYYLDETPFDLRGDGFSGAPDLDFFDVARVEVLRGPQGTLYGSSSVGGTIRVITNAPDPSRLQFRTESTLTETKGSGGLGYSLKGLANVPLASNLAARLQASHTRFAGFVDRVRPIGGYRAVSPTDPVESENDNTARLTTLRLAVKWTPADWAITPSVSYQRSTTNGYAYSDSNRPRYQYSGEKTSENNNRFVVANLTIQKPLGSATLTSSTSYLDKKAVSHADYSAFSDRLYRAVLGAPLNSLLPTNSYLPKTYRQFTQEIRLSSDSDGPLKWVSGLYFSHTKTHEEQYITSQLFGEALASAAGVPPSDNVVFDIIPSRDKQIAGFFDATYSVLPILDVSAGVRLYHYSQTYSYSEGGLLSNGIALDKQSSKKTGVNPRFNVNLKATDDVSFYLTAAKGFRVGGTNPALISGGGTCTFEDVFRQGFGPDSVWNYEAGVKGQMLDRRLTINGAAYRIDWSNIQQQINSSCGSFVGNFGEARIKGLEVESALKLTDALTLSGSASYTHAEFTGFNPGYEASAALTPGQRLVNIPRYQASGSAEYRVPVGDDKSVFARADVQYTGSTPTSYTNVTPIYDRPSFTNVNLTVGGEFGNIEAQLFVRNVTNSFQIVDIQPSQARTFARYITTPPRTVGVTVRTSF